MTSTSLLSAETETRRALQLDALAGILPMERRDRLATILTDDDVATLRHLAKEGMGENSLRALASDLAYLEAWALVATGSALPWPAPEALVLKFVAHQGAPQGLFAKPRYLGRSVNMAHAACRSRAVGSLSER